MANLKQIRRRIASVKNTQKITRAMKLVSTAKFARANQAVNAARPYSEALDAMVGRVVAAAAGDFSSPLSELREEKRSLLVFLATDRGFCGALNANLYKQLLPFFEEKRKAGVRVDLAVWGKRARQFGRKMKAEIVDKRELVTARPTHAEAKKYAEELAGRFLVSEGKAYDRVYLGFSKFKSALSQVPTIVQLLPAVPADEEGSTQAPNMIIEPEAAKLLPSLLKKQLAGRVFQAILDAAASEHGARMTAMDSATNNAQEVLRKLTIQYNRARQAVITKELIEITSGAEAL